MDPTTDLLNYAAAIRAIESSGNYKSLGPITKRGDRAYGAYQVMGSNIPEWTKGALGRSMTPQEFLGDKNAQDSVFNKYFGDSVAKYGNPNDAASVWFTGQPQSVGGNRDDGFIDGNEYVKRFAGALAAARGQAPTQEAGDMGDTTELSARSQMPQLPGQPSASAQGLGGIGGSLQEAGAFLMGQPGAAAALSYANNNKRKPQFGVIGQDKYGQPQYGFIDTNTMRVIPMSQLQGGTSAQQLDPNKTMYEQFDKPQRGLVDAMLEGRQPLPAGKALTNPYWMRMIEAADEKSKAAGGQGFDAGLWQQRNKTYQDAATGGKGGQLIQALDTLDTHLAKNSNAVERLDNGDYPLVNSAKNYIANSTGMDKQRRDALSEFENSRKALIDEMGKAWKNGVLSDHEIKEWSDKFSNADSKEKQRRALYDFNELVDGKRAAYLRGFSGIMDGQLPKNYDPTQHNAVSKTLKERHLSSDLGAPAGASADTSAVPVTIGDKQYIKRNGQWYPAQ